MTAENGIPMSSARKFRKRPVEIEAMQFTGDNADEVCAWIGEAGHTISLFGSFRIHTLEGDMHVSVGDWVIRGVQGEHYPCKPDIFEATYEAVVCGE
jgi:hypothetical protein